MNTYEAMFLVDATVAAREWDKVMAEIQRLAAKSNASIVASNKWGERKLAYPVRGNKRGTYVLAFVNADSDGLAKLRRDCELSDLILRSLFLRHEGEVKLSIAPQELPPREDSYGGARRERRY